MYNTDLYSKHHVHVHCPMASISLLHNIDGMTDFRTCAVCTKASII